MYQHAILKSRRCAGLTLIETMIAMVIGLVILGAALSVFLSNQITFRDKTALDEAQESFRFVSHTINRLIKVSNDVASTSDANTLVLDVQGGAGVRNCLGKPHTSGMEANTFSLAGNAIVCSDGIDTEPLVGGVESFSLLYGWDENEDGRVSNAEYLAAGAIDAGNWDKVTSIKVTLGMQSGLTAAFVSSMRTPIFDLITVDLGGGGV
jgi:type IV pilus assembly protein PilW